MNPMTTPKLCLSESLLSAQYLTELSAALSIEGHGWPITLAASANQNVTNNILSAATANQNVTNTSLRTASAK